MKRFDKYNKEINEGDRVLILEHRDAGVPNIARRFFTTKQVYGLVASDAVHKDMCYGNSIIIIDFSKSCPALKGFREKLVSAARSYVYLIPKEEYGKYETIAANINTEAEKMLEKVKTMLDLKPSTESYMNRTFRFEDLNALDTNFGFCVLGKWDEIMDTFQPDHTKDSWLIKCCQFTQSTNDMEVYIPEIWLSYTGYTIFDLVEWLNFLSKCELGFKAKFYGKKPLHNLLKIPDQKVIKDTGYEEMENLLLRAESVENTSILTPKDRDGFYCIRIKGDNNYPYISYVRYLLLRYIFCNNYWTIPGHAMQIKRALGGEVTYWQALLMAHLYKDFEPYYSLCTQVDFDRSKVYEYFDLSPYKIDLNYDRHIDPFQDVKSFLKRMEKHTILSSVNRQLVYICDTYKREELNKFFYEKDYVGLYNYLKERQEIKEESKQWRLLGNERFRNI